MADAGAPIEDEGNHDGGEDFSPKDFYWVKVKDEQWSISSIMPYQADDPLLKYQIAVEEIYESAGYNPKYKALQVKVDDIKKWEDDETPPAAKTVMFRKLKPDVTMVNVKVIIDRPALLVYFEPKEHVKDTEEKKDIGDDPTGGPHGPKFKWPHSITFGFLEDICGDMAKAELAGKGEGSRLAKDYADRTTRQWGRVRQLYDTYKGMKASRKHVPWGSAAFRASKVNQFELKKYLKQKHSMLQIWAPGSKKK